MLTKEIESATIDPQLSKGLRILLLHTRWNTDVVSALHKGCLDTLTSRYSIPAASIHTVVVPGAYELPFASRSLIRQAREQGTPYDAVVAIGVLIKGGTMHFEYICDSVSHALMKTGLDTDTPVIFGVLTCLSDEQARQRAGIAGPQANEGHNHGVDWAAAAVEMALLNKGHVQAK
ncbi:lumazine synthase [Sorochytrium milnesiophthora]